MRPCCESAFWGPFQRIENDVVGPNKRSELWAANLSEAKPEEDGQAGQGGNKPRY